MTVTDVPCKFESDELIVTVLPDTENQADAASVGLKLSVSVRPQAFPTLSFWVQAGIVKS